MGLKFKTDTNRRQAAEMKSKLMKLYFRQHYNFKKQYLPYGIFCFVVVFFVVG